MVCCVISIQYDDDGHDDDDVACVHKTQANARQRAAPQRPATQRIRSDGRLVGVEFNAPLDTIYVISETVFTDNHLTDTDRQNSTGKYRQTNSIQIRKSRQPKIQQNKKTTPVQLPLTTLGQETRWAYSTTPPRPHEHACRTSAVCVRRYVLGEVSFDLRVAVCTVRGTADTVALHQPWRQVSATQSPIHADSLSTTQSQTADSAPVVATSEVTLSARKVVPCVR